MQSIGSRQQYIGSMKLYLILNSHHPFCVMDRIVYCLQYKTKIYKLQADPYAQLFKALSYNL